MKKQSKPMGQHKMSNGMMMSDKEMQKMMKAKGMKGSIKNMKGK